MLIMVIEKPIQLTMVSAVPFTSESALCATNVENKGESAMTTIPQIDKNISRMTIEDCNNMKGERTQLIPDINKELEAMFFSP